MIRRKGAEGSLPVSMQEKIEILALLSSDADEGIRTTAISTLRSLDSRELQAILSDPKTHTQLLKVIAGTLLNERKELAEAILNNPSLPDDVRDQVIQSMAKQEEAAAKPQEATPPAGAVTEEAGKDGDKEKERETLLQRIGRMSAAEKIKTALTGNQEERMVLVRDSNKIVSRAVLQSPKLSDQEIENFASMKNVTEEILRLIAMNRKFMKSYSVVRQLLNNPRTPIDVGLPLLNRMNERDLKGLMLNKNIAEVIRGMAQKMIKQREEAAKPKLPGKH